MQRMPPRPLETPNKTDEWHGLATGLVFVDLTSMEDDVGPEVVGKQIQWTENIDNSFFFYLPLMFLPIKLICAKLCTDSVVVCLLYLTLQQLHELWKQSDRVSMDREWSDKDQVFHWTCESAVLWTLSSFPCLIATHPWRIIKSIYATTGKMGEVRISLSMEVAHSKSNNLIYNSTKTFLGA